MSGAAIVAFGAVSAQGEAEDAFRCGFLGEPARESIANDEVLASAGLARPFVARAALRARENGVDRATALLARALGDCAAMLDRERPGWRGLRVGLALGTSSGGMETAEQLFRGVALRDSREAMYFGPIVPALACVGMSGMRFAPATLVLGACASSTLALGIGTRWLAQDACDLVLAGGFDAVTVFVASGFEALRATTGALPPRPFRVERDGMALGEGAGVVALAAVVSKLADQPKNKKPYGYIAGFGASADAVHVTAPDRTGAGLAAAAARALGDAGISPDAVDLISAHATATPFNDPAEWRALVATLEGRAPAVPVHPFKAQIGHTLGAAGVLESLACLDAFGRGVFPAAAGQGVLDPEAPARLFERTVAASPQPPHVAIKLSSAFGGANAALVLSDAPPDVQEQVRPLYPAYVTPAFAVDRVPDIATLAAETRASATNLSRSDALVRLALAAVARLAAAHGSLEGAGIIVGQAFATLETNALYFERILARGARLAEGRRFPYTSPNAVAGECGVAFGLTGPAFAVGGGLHAGVEALAVAAQLVQAGDAERIVVVAVDDVGPVVTRLLGQPPFSGVELMSGAVAVLVSRSPAGAALRVGPITLELAVRARPPFAVGHRGLLPLVVAGFTGQLQSSCPSGGFASVGLLPV